MTQERLNHLMVLQVHKDLTAKLNLHDIGNEFVGQSDRRLLVLNFVFKKDLTK